MITLVSGLRLSALANFMKKYHDNDEILTSAISIVKLH